MKDKTKNFEPKTNNPLPWCLMSSDDRARIWFGVSDANGKRVCNCRNIKDAELIVKAVNNFNGDK